jgi:minor extracellular serine protease Vpr
VGADRFPGPRREGVKVAIIDSGIRPEHPMFQSNGHTRPAGLPNDDYCSTIDASFCNDKLVLARYYAPTFQVHPDENISPLDFNGHGTHVTGTAVGNAVTATIDSIEVNISGVAPGATLMVYRAFYQTDTSPGASSSIQLVAALEDAVADGADIINNSWGGSIGSNPANSVYTPIFAAAEAAGVLMVSSAGNSGPGANTIGCPACAEAGLAVASTQTGRVFGNVSWMRPAWKASSARAAMAISRSPRRSAARLCRYSR